MSAPIDNESEPPGSGAAHGSGDDDDFGDDDAMDDDALNCGLTRDGGCLEAGSEFCEFECPYRRH